MGEILLNKEFKSKNHFKIDYPYYGLFGSADITPIDKENELVFRCKLLNGNIVYLKKLLKLSKWIDVNLNIETQLSAVMGISIDDYMSK